MRKEIHRVQPNVLKLSYIIDTSKRTKTCANSNPFTVFCVCLLERNLMVQDGLVVPNLDHRPVHVKVSRES